MERGGVQMDEWLAKFGLQGFWVGSCGYDALGLGVLELWSVRA